MNRLRRRIAEVNAHPYPAGCIFYAPLTQGDMNDHVNGLLPNADTGTFTWRGNIYEFSANVQQSGAIYYESAVPLIDLSTQNCTIVFDMEEFSASGNNWFAAIKLGKKDFVSYPVQFYTAHIFYYPTATMATARHRYATTWNAANQSCTSYVDGALTDSNRPRSLTTGIADCVNICFLPANNNSYITKIANVYIFNRILTTTEIMAL